MSRTQNGGFELEIASHLAEANAYQENAAFEALIHGSPSSKGTDLETATAMVEKVYVTSLPWIRAQLRLQAHKFSRVSLDSEFSGGRMNILH